MAEFERKIKECQNYAGFWGLKFKLDLKNVVLKCGLSGFVIISSYLSGTLAVIVIVAKRNF